MARLKVGGGFGFVILLVVVVIVLLLAARSTREVAPIALQLNEPETAVNDHGQPEAKEALSNLPGLGEVKDSTAAHAEELSQALAETQ
jgi:hypothetical protein